MAKISWDNLLNFISESINGPKEASPLTWDYRMVFNTPTPSPTPTPTPTPTPKPTPIPVIGVNSPETDEFLNTVALPITRKYGIPDAVAAGQFAGEGRLAGLGASRNNYYNIAAYDNDLDSTVKYETPEKGIEAYAKLLSGNFKKANGEMDTRYLPAYELRADPVKMLQEIFKAGYATRPDYPEHVMNTPEWRNNYKQTKE